MADPFSKALLIILDGYGLAENPEVSAIEKARKPFLDFLFSSCPHSKLSASGKDVGLPEGQFGNSEVGHLNIGAGRVVRQELLRINEAIQDGSFAKNEVLLNSLNNAREKNRIHLIGLFSDGGVHSQNSHLYALLELIQSEGIENAYVHAFTDGRDTSPTAGIEYVREFNKRTEQIGSGCLVSVIGRYYAMDRDNRWERTKKAFDLLVNGKGENVSTAEEGLSNSYRQEVTDEFVKPLLIGPNAEESRIQRGDSVIFFNIRGDRARQLTRALSDPNFNKFERDQYLDLNFTTFTSYDETFDQVKVAFPPGDIKNTLAEVISNRHLKQLRVAETEKYPHVTYFFNGGEEIAFRGEDRILIPSPRVPTYDLKPEMSAKEVADALCAQLITEKYHLGILNFANPDMVGHTGVMEAAIKAVECVDRQLKKVVEKATEHGYRILIVADHGNADCMINEDETPHTAHTDAPVPALIVNKKNIQKMKNGKLADVAPTLLKLMNIEKPPEMTGTSLY